MYVAAPVGAIVNEVPEQTEPLFTATTGKALTVTVATAVLDDAHPKTLVPVTE